MIKEALPKRDGSMGGRASFFHNAKGMARVFSF